MRIFKTPTKDELAECRKIGDPHHYNRRRFECLTDISTREAAIARLISRYRSQFKAGNVFSNTNPILERAQWIKNRKNRTSKKWATNAWSIAKNKSKEYKNFKLKGHYDNVELDLTDSEIEQYVDEAASLAAAAKEVANKAAAKSATNPGSKFGGRRLTRSKRRAASTRRKRV